MSTLQSKPANTDPKRGKRDCPVICSGHEYFTRAFQQKIANNRTHRGQRWIFELIAGRVGESETVYIDRAQWMMVLNNQAGVAATDRRYLVIFKDAELHSIRNLEARHVPLLLEVEECVRAFLLGAHPERHRQYRCYFHYMPSVFQLHMHVCTAKTSDAGRVHPVDVVRRNLNVKSSWYRDALILCPAHRHQRNISGGANFEGSTKGTNGIFNTGQICSCLTTRPT